MLVAAALLALVFFFTFGEGNGKGEKRNVSEKKKGWMDIITMVMVVGMVGGLTSYSIKIFRLSSTDSFPSIAAPSSVNFFTISMKK